MKVTVCTMYSQSHEEIAAICVPNLRRYCDKHGYGLHEIRIENDKYAYEKHYDFHKLFEEGVEVIFYCDVDSLIMRHDIRIEDLIDGEHDLFISKDATELNGGSLIIKGTEEGKLLNLLVLSYKEQFENEQNALCHIYENQILINGKQCIKLLPQTLLNAYDHSLYPELLERVGRPDLGDWDEQSFLIHFPALNPADKLAMMREYKDKIKYE